MKKLRHIGQGGPCASAKADARQSTRSIRRNYEKQLAKMTKNFQEEYSRQYHKHSIKEIDILFAFMGAFAMAAFFGSWVIGVWCFLVTMTVFIIIFQDF